MFEEAQTNIENIQERFEQWSQELGSGLYEREQAVKMVLLAALAGHNTFLLGEPGIAKSLLAQRLQYLIRDDEGQDEAEGKAAQYFEYLMHQFSEPEQLFGPLDLQKLKQGEYHTKTEGYLPTAHIAFLDEIWKANPAIQNTLLWLLNEKKFNNGNQIQEVPLLAFICASNELPAQDVDQNQSLQALWDRITVRLKLYPLQDSANFTALLNAPKASKQCQISQPLSITALRQLRSKSEALPLGPVAEDAILHMRQKLHDLPPEQAIFVSDRRWQQIAQLIRCAAWVNGHQQPDIVDCSVMLHSLWHTEEDCETLNQFWQEILQQHAIASEVDTAALERQITGYHREIQQHYTEEQHELVVDSDGFIDFVKPIKFDSSRTYIAIHKDSWQQLQAGPQQFHNNWWTPTIRCRLNDGRIEVFQNHSYTQCMIEPRKTNWKQTQIHQVNSNSWTGLMQLKTRKIKDAGFDTAKFLQQNKKAVVKEVTENKKLFSHWEGLYDGICQEIASNQQGITAVRDDKAKSYSSNHFIAQDTLNRLTEPAAKCLAELETLRLKAGAIRKEYQTAMADTHKIFDDIRKQLGEA